MITAQWVNSEHTTLETTVDGVTIYVMRDLEGSLTSQDNNVIALKVAQWIEEGNNPLPYFQPGG